MNNLVRALLILCAYHPAMQAMNAAVFVDEERIDLDQSVKFIQNEYKLHQLPRGEGVYLAGMNPKGLPAPVPQIAGENEICTQPITPPTHVAKAGEAVLKRAIPGVDGRTKVPNPLLYPHCCFAHLDLTFPSTKGSGSGFAIGQQHVLTAAHCVFHKGERIKRVVVYFALDGNVKHFKAVEAATVFIPKEYVKTGNSDYDFALIVLKEPLALETGWIGCLHSNDGSLIRDKKISVTGYPADKGGKEMYTMRHDALKVGSKKVYYLHDTFPGQSGCAVWLRYPVAEKNLPMAVTVHTSGEATYGEGNSGTRINLEYIERIRAWMNKTWVSAVSVPKHLDIQQGSHYKAYALLKKAYTTLLKKEALIKTGVSEAAITEEDVLCEELIPYGDDYFFGARFPQDFNAALALYKQAKANELTNAERRMGEMYHYGLGEFAPNIENAREFYNRVAQHHGNHEAKAWANLRLGELCYEEAKMLKENIREAKLDEARLFFDEAISSATSEEAQIWAKLRLAIMDYESNSTNVESFDCFSKIAAMPATGVIEEAVSTARLWLAKAHLDRFRNNNINKDETQDLQAKLNLQYALALLKTVISEGDNKEERNVAYRFLSDVYKALGQ